ncbi:MAG: M28 family peptidase [Vicinamibacterales bacterium]
MAIGPRPSGSPEIVRTREYIAAQLRAAGLDAREQAFTAQTPNGAIGMVNLIATIPGRRADRLVIGTHYDTKLFREFRFVGASDAASSTSVVLELGRVLKDAQPEYTIELLFLDGEEAVVDWYTNNDNTYGSRHYVQAAREDGSLAGVKAFILLDMVGDKDLRISRDSNSTPWLVDIVWEAAARIGHRARFPDALTTIDDDHIPFLRAGIPSVDIIDLDYPAWHTANDTLEAVSAESLQVVGDVVIEALPGIQRQLSAGR